MKTSRRSFHLSLAALAATVALPASLAAQGARRARASKIKLVILDIGGTIIQDHGEVPTALMSALSHRGVEAKASEIAEWRGASKREMVRHFVERSGKPKSLIEPIYADFSAQADKAYANVQPIAGAEDALKQMRADGLLLATTTGFGRELTEKVMHHLNWKQYFVANVTSDDVVDARPSPFMLFHAMEAAHVDNVADVVAVGDTPLDLQAANNAGVRGVIGVWSGAATQERLRKEHYSQLLPSVAALPGLLRTAY
jgi:phosphonatase-like hydrolase